MDPLRLGRQLASGGLKHTNSTGNMTLANLPANLLEAIVPGYSIISRFINETFGFDISLFVSVLAIFWAVTKTVGYLWKAVNNVFEDYCMCNVHIDDSDDLYDTALQWIAEQRMTQQARSVKARSARGSAWDEDMDEKRAASSALGADGTFNYGKWQARVPPRYEPYYGTHRFWHKGRYFLFRRSQRQRQVIQTGWQSSSTKDDDLLQLSCVGYNTRPVKELLQEIKVWSIKKQFSRTTIRHPSGKNSRWSGQWSRTNSRPSRPMATVILDQEQKAMIQRDMNDFLHPSSPKWYATRGIPYRRGYLFHGPPGTGKTSLSFALAGIFGLDIHCIALNDPEMTETDLRELFNSLPRRCIVLLEDIDQAGIKRNDDADDEKSTDRSKAKKGAKESKDTAVNEADNGDLTPAPPQDDTHWTLQDLARALKNVASEPSPSPSPSQSTRHRRGGARGRQAPGAPMSAQANNLGISLSGLLNAIDGVATHEGRILIMTTNHPDKLDAALVRTGRVDMQIKFTFAKRAQIQELFLRMYTPDRPASVAALSERDDDAKEIADGLSMLDLEATRPEAAKSELRDIAQRFAAELPDEGFSPSDIQGFLLLHKNNPRKALHEVRGWRDAELARRDGVERSEMNGTDKSHHGR